MQKELARTSAHIAALEKSLVVLRPGESPESLLKRFRKQVARDRILSAMLSDGQVICFDGIRVVPATSIPPFHLFVGVEEDGRVDK